MAYTYDTFKAALAKEMEVDPAGTDFLAMLPTFIDDAEQRIYRDLDLLSTVTRAEGTATANSRTFGLPTSGGRFITVQGINVIAGGVRSPCAPSTVDAIDFIWPSETATSSSVVPNLFAMLTDQTVIFGPPPGAAFTVEVVGTIRPTPLSASNASTYLTNYLSDLFFAAAMISASGYQRNFGAQGDDPKMAVSWEGQYQARLQSADKEENRKKFASVSWTSREPSGQTAPERG